MQPDLRKLICEHIIRVLQHQKDVNQKQRSCVKHDFVGSNHTISQLAFRYNRVEDSRFRQHVLIYTMMEVYPYCNVLEFKGETKGMFCTTEKIKLPLLREQSHYKFCLLDILWNQNISYMTSGNTIHVSK
ncbi:hypothetical protein TNCV_3862951 [Trichonephila clavipes]|uniref:Uncharacterized protein n=1 Tax=Trichonephila clavipes TaxID=2585209 RepID=A0A8X6SCL4_TRICX|nr:hypothetical protein TNCV_3862951 [Trichonephila clavipes]